jgi:hypothetical protein
MTINPLASLIYRSFMTETNVIGLVHNPDVSFTIRFFQAGGSAQGLKLPSFVQKKYFSAGRMNEVKPAVCFCPQEETISHYQPPGIK